MTAELLPVDYRYIAARLGVSMSTVRARVEWLIDHHNFPQPLPAPDVARKPRWLRPAVDAWFDGLVPADLAAASRGATLRGASAELDRRAAQMGASA